MTPNTPFERVIRLVSGICVGAAGVIACLVLLSWLTGHGMIGALKYGYVPMAPGTAGAILLLTLSVLVSILHPEHPLGIKFCWLSAFLTGTISIIGMALLLFAPESLFSEWIIPAKDRVVGQPVSVISPVTALVLFLYAAAQALESPPGRRKRSNRQAASAFAFVGGLISCWVVLGYILGIPVLYGTDAVPMALSSGIALSLLSTGLIYRAAPGVWPMSRILPDDSAEPSRWTAKGPLVAFLLLFATIAVVGGIELEMQQVNMRSAAHAELDAVADLKIQDIAHWRQERLADAHFFANAAFVARDLQEFLADPNAGTIRAEVVNWLTLLKGGERYFCASVFDASGDERLSIPPQPEPLDSDMRALVSGTLKDNAISMTDLHEGAGHEVYLSLTVPVHAPGADPAAAPIGVIVLRMDPRQFLFPLIQTWPTRSTTAETLIVRREGDEVLYLSDLRHREGAAMKLRVSVDQDSLPEVRAVQGKTGLVEAVDYRNVPVVAVLRKVPDSTWFLVAKVDQTEIYAASRRQALHIAAIMALLVLAAGLGIVALWRQRNMEYFRQTLDQETKQGILTQRFEHLMRQANDCILLADENGNIVEANDRAIQVYGQSQAELRCAGLVSLRAPGARAQFETQMAELAKNGNIRFETVHQRADGTEFPVEVSARMVDIGGAAHQLFIVRDITGRREREREIERLNRLYAALSHVNQSIVRSQTQQEMLESVCAALVEHGGLQVAWMGQYDSQESPPSPRAWRCMDGSPTPNLALVAECLRQGQRPVAGTASGVNRPVVCLDLSAMDFGHEARPEIDRLGICAVAALPIRLGKMTWGVLAVGAKDAGYFGDREMALLEEAANDVSFALDHLAIEAERRRAEDQLHETQQRLALAVEGARLGLWDWDLRTNAVHFSREYKRQLGYEDGDFYNTRERWEENLHPDDREWTLGAIEDFIRQRGEYQELEFRLKHRDGSYRWMLSRAVLRCGPEGVPEQMIGCHIDITDRKHAEEALRRSEENLVLAERIAHVGYWERSLDGVSILWSDEAYRVFGLEPQERPINLPAFLAMVHPEDRDAVLEAIRATREEDRPYNIDYRIVRPDGSVRFVHSQGELFLDALGRPSRVFGTMLDITERKQAEAALRESEQRYRLITENSGDVIWQLDLASLKFTYVSPSVMRLRGYTPDEVMAQSMEEALTPDSFRQVVESIVAYQANPEANAELRSPRTSIVKQPCRDGSVVTTEVVTTALTDELGNVVGILGVTRDISDRVRAEESLRKSEERFRAAFEVGLFGMVLISTDGHFVEVNPAFCQMLGYSEAELKAHTFIDITHPGDRAESADEVRKLLAGIADSFELEKRYLDKQGRTVWGVVRARVLRDPDGMPRLLLAQVLDTTARKKAEQEIIANQDRLNRAQAVGRIGSWEYNPHARNIWGSAEACRILGLPVHEREVSADEVESRIPEWGRIHQAMVDQLGERSAYDVELTLNPIDGGPQRTLRVVAELVLDDRGQPARIVGVSEDITDQKRTAEQLQETQERLYLALQSSGVGTLDWIIDEKRHIWDANTRLLFGMAPDNDAELETQFMAAVHPEDRDRILEELDRAVRTQTDGETEFRVVWSDGSVHDLSVRGKVYRDPSGRAVRMIGVCWDITARKEVEAILKADSSRLGLIIEERTRQLREAQDELVRKGKLAVLGQLAGGVGHELRNPLGIISNAIYYLKLVNVGADETGREYLNIISTEVRNCQKIITDLLGFARTGRADRSTVALPMLVAEVLAQVAPSADVDVVLNFPVDLPLLSVDPGQVRQVLSNIMLNACQAMQNGGTLTVGGCCREGRVLVSITDTGCGMSEEELKRIFEPLYSTKARGIGLGLSVTKNLVDANGGAIEVTSKPGKGSTFTVALPTQE